MAGFTLEENFVSIASLSFTFLEALVAIVFAFVVCRKLPSVEKWIITWLVYDVLTHFTLVGWYIYDVTFVAWGVRFFIRTLTRY